MDYEICPFNKAHKVLRPRLQHHIIKCMVNYPNFVACIYNSLHWFETKEKMMEHAKTCPSQILVIESNEKVREHFKVTPNPRFESRKFHQEEENWDDDYR